MSDHIDDLIRDTLTPKDKPPPTDAFRAVAEAAYQAGGRRVEAIAFRAVRDAMIDEEKVYYTSYWEQRGQLEWFERGGRFEVKEDVSDDH